MMLLAVARTVAAVSKQSKAFQDDTRGAIAIIFSFVFIILLGLIGASIDFGNAYRAREELLAAADSASLSVVSASSDSYKLAAAATHDGHIPEAEAAAVTAFNAIVLGQATGIFTPQARANVIKSGASIRATVSFTASAPSHFLELFGIDTVSVNGHATSINGLPAFIDFYLLLDNSPSMGIAATSGDIATLSGANGGCAFACHEGDHEGHDSYALAHDLGVKTRIDVLREATQSLMDTAAATATVADQFRMSIDTFNITTHAISGLTSDLARAKADAATIDLMEVPAQGWNNDRDTNFEVALNDTTAKVPPSDSGIDTNHTQKVVFFVTDGVADQVLNTAETVMPWNNQPGGNRLIQVVNPELCKAMKDKGIKVAVIYTASPPIAGWWQQHVAPFAPEINPNALACASPGYFFEVAPNQGIDEAMKALFLKAVAEARLSS